MGFGFGHTLTAQDTGAGEPGLGERWDQGPILAWLEVRSVCIASLGREHSGQTQTGKLDTRRGQRLERRRQAMPLPLTCLSRQKPGGTHWGETPPR